MELNKYEIVGNILQSKRIDLNLSQEKICEDLNLNIKYLKMIEDGDFVNANLKIYYFGYIKKFSDYIKIDYNKLIQVLDDINESIAKDESYTQNGDNNINEYLFSKVKKTINNRSENIVAITIIVLCIFYFIISIILTKIRNS